MTMGRKGAEEKNQCTPSVCFVDLCKRGAFDLLSAKKVFIHDTIVTGWSVVSRSGSSNYQYLPISFVF